MGKAQEQSGKRKSTKRAAGAKSIEVAEQIRLCQDLLIKYHSMRAIRDILLERYGLPESTANDRIKAAREAIKDDINGIERQELAATMAEMCLSIAAQAEARGQYNNVIGAMRLLGELGGLSGQNKV